MDRPLVSALDKAATHMLVFRSLFMAGRGLSFPCDLHGLVDLDRLSDRGPGNCLYARVLTGREFEAPTIVRLGTTGSG